jgi:putative SOS response-associated peptidase YedK
MENAAKCHAGQVRHEALKTGHRPMCGRFTLTKDLQQMMEAYPAFSALEKLAARYNIAPSQPVVTVMAEHPDKMDLTQWGLVPSWADDPRIGYRMINARAETLTEKPAWKKLFRRKRCVLFADGFYEWKSYPGTKAKQPMYFRLKSRRAFVFAGLYDEWHDKEGGFLVTSSIITTTPNQLVQPVHDRMPAILPQRLIPAWLDADCDRTEQLSAMLAPYPSSEMEAYPVSCRMNRPAHDEPDCIEPIEAGGGPEWQAELF